jgi:endonuclease/exonuclease/phosphatase family metal-dependent hydrolase
MTKVRVLTLNIWNRCGPWEERCAAIRQCLRELDADLVGLQEVIVTPDGDRLDQGAALAEGFGYHVCFGASHVDGYSFGNALLSRWPVVQSQVFALTVTGALEKRSLLFAEIASPMGKLPVFVTHLSWKLDEGFVRERQVQEIVEHVTRLAPRHGLPPIVMGDFNAEPDADEMRFLRGLKTYGGKSVYFSDCYAVAGVAGGTVAAPGATYAKRNTFAAGNREPDRRIDYIYVRGPDEQLRGEPVSAKVCCDEPVGGVFPSDHFGVVAEIRI